MPLSAAAGKALGKLYRDVRNPRWIAQQATESVISITVLNWAGQKVKAFFKGKIFHKPDGHRDEVHIGDVYHCADGHNYVHAGGKAYRYDAGQDAWVSA